MDTRVRGEGRYPWCFNSLRACDFFSGVCHPAPSAPGVCVPGCAVTRRIARTLALHERVKLAEAGWHARQLLGCLIRAIEGIGEIEVGDLAPDTPVSALSEAGLEAADNLALA